MAKTIHGPRVLEEPIVIYKGESWKPRADVKDGVRTSTKPYGAAVEVSTATIKGVLRVNKPDGTTDVTRDTSVSGEGEKVQTADGAAEGKTKDAFQLYVGGDVTGGWNVGVHDFECEYQDTAPTTEDKRLVLVGQLDIRTKPSDT